MEQLRKSFVRTSHAGARRVAEALNLLGSKVGSHRFFDPADFAWVQPLEQNWRSIRAELDEILTISAHLPQFHDVSPQQQGLDPENRWKTLFLFAAGQPNEEICQLCPHTALLLERIPDLFTAFFSILAAGAKLPSHRGPYNGVLRYHLALLVPEPARSCGINVGGETAYWEEGKSLVFDDTYRHYAWNEGATERVVLFIDFKRPIRKPLSILNDLALKQYGSGRMARTLMRRQEVWNRSIVQAFKDRMQ